MVLRFENSIGVIRDIAEVSSKEDAFAEIQKFLSDHNYKSYYTRHWNENPYHTIYDVGSWSEFFHLVTPCVLVEIDHKGSYGRFALTPNEFEERYRKAHPSMPKAHADGTTYTLRPLVHIWYEYTDVGSTDWCNFFTDMEYGLPQTDIDEGNAASVLKDEFGELRSTWEEFDKAL